MKAYCSLVLLASIIPALIFADASGRDSDVYTVAGENNPGGGKVDLTNTGLTTSYCTVVGKQCPGADLYSDFEPTLDQCTARCSRWLTPTPCLSIYYNSAPPKQGGGLCELRGTECPPNQLQAASGNTYYRLKVGEKCPPNEPLYVEPVTKYSASFCVARNKSCPVYDMYPKPENFPPFDTCLKKCANLITCGMTDYNTRATAPNNWWCSPKSDQCTDAELVDTPGMDNYIRLPIGVNKCSAGREPIPVTVPAPATAAPAPATAAPKVTAAPVPVPKPAATAPPATVSACTCTCTCSPKDSTTNDCGEKVTKS